MNEDEAMKTLEDSVIALAVLQQFREEASYAQPYFGDSCSINDGIGQSLFLSHSSIGTIRIKPDGTWEAYRGFLDE